MHLSGLRYLVRSVGTMPRVTIAVGEEPGASEFYAFVTRRHRRYFFVRNKCWGVAALKVPDTSAEYLQGSSKAFLRRQVRAASSAGYRFSEIAALDHIDEILEINASCPVRQGHAIDSLYLDKTALERYFSTAQPVFGVRDRTGALRAYLHAPVFGEVGVFNRLLGHHDHLKNGVMYLLISEAIRVMCERKASSGTPIWVIYDTMFGAGRGLRYFKERLGFTPHRVSWRQQRFEPVDGVTSLGRQDDAQYEAARETRGKGSLRVADEKTAGGVQQP